MATSALTPSISRCGFCNRPGELQRCTRCKVIFYCNREHQTAHYPTHKAACNAVAKAQRLVDTEEQKLRNHPGDWAMPADPFTNSLGHFWGVLGTRDYMRARLRLGESLRALKSRESVQSQFDSYMDILLRLNRSDNMGVRSLIPGLMLQLDKDQEAYDFMKWYAEVDSRGDYDWGNMDEPFLDLRGADVFESPEMFSDEYFDLSFRVAVTLLKIKLLIDLKTLQHSTLLGVKGPPEILDRIQSYIPRSPIIAGNKEIMERRDHSIAIDTLEEYVEDLYVAVDQDNEYFWPALLNPGRHLTARPAYTSRGTEDEMQVSLQSCYDAWIGTPGAIDWIRNRVQRNNGGHT